MNRRQALLAALIVVTFALMLVWPREPVTFASMFAVCALVAFGVDDKGVRG